MGTKVFSTDLGELHNTDCLSWLKNQESRSLHCCITSPPYWGLRNYEVDEQLGQEQSPDEYIANLRNIFRELYRVLDQRGSLWLNLGDNYYGGPPKSQPKDAKGLVREVSVEKVCERCGGVFVGKSTRRFCSSKCGGSLNRKRTAFERPKCLLGLPWRVATGLVEDGWILRNDIIWQKPNARPAPYRDRLTLTHEHLFHFVKQGIYVNGRKYDGSYNYNLSIMQTEAIGGGVKNIGDVWSIKTTPSKDAHFAVFPKELVERPMRATTPEGGVVYDPFMGSGTVAVVAEEYGYRWKGTEINKDYCQIIESKLKNKCQREE